jgi:DNA replication and repair protein RecF
LFLKSLRLQQFRNYEQADLTFSSVVNLFIGNNAQGKTNILEAIYLLALARSHRAHHDRELIQWDQATANVLASVDKRYGECELQMTVSKNGKQVRVNGLQQKKMSEFIGQLNVVLFAPEDLELVKGSPNIRRNFLNMEISQIYPSYVHHLRQYIRALDHKNKLLRTWHQISSEQQQMLTIFNEQLAINAAKILKIREEFLRKLRFWSKKIHDGISNQTEDLDIQYHSSLAVDLDKDDSVLIEEVMVKLEMVKEKEIRQGNALIGPHRDDLLFFINQREVAKYGSQGQQRTAALSVKLAEIELIQEMVGEYPILLLDDVLSELDELRQTHLIHTFQDKVQTFITTTSIANIDMNLIGHADQFIVTQGTIERSVD